MKQKISLSDIIDTDLLEPKNQKEEGGANASESKKVPEKQGSVSSPSLGWSMAHSPVVAKLDKKTRRERILGSKLDQMFRSSSFCGASDEKGFSPKDAKAEKLSDSSEQEGEVTYIESHPEWNSKFQRAVDAVNKIFGSEASGVSDTGGRQLRNSNEELYSCRRASILKSFSKLADLYCNFIDTATWYGKIIISERYLPVEHKTIKPNGELGGIAGGEKYIVHNIIFKFSTDHVGLFGNDHNSQKLASHELKGLIHMFNHGSKLGLYVPMMTVLDYKGFRLIAMSRLPVKGNETLVYGSRDAGATILTNPQFREKLAIVCEEIGLKPHYVIPKPSNLGNSSSENMHNSAELSKSAEASYSPENQILMHTPVDLEGHKGLDGRDYLLDFSRLFPPEAPDKNVRCSHLFRLFRPEFVKMYAKSRGRLSPDAFSKFSRGTQTAKEDNEEIERATRYLHEVQIPKCVKQLEAFVSIDPFAFVESFHRNGVNFRHFGNARRVLLKKVETESTLKWANLLLIEMLARTIKNEIGHLMRCQVDHANVPGDQKLKQIVSNYLNTIFGDSVHSRRYWNKQLKDKLSQSFPNALTKDELECKNFGASIHSTDQMCLLFKRTIQMSGLRLTAEATLRFQRREHFGFEYPVDDTDIEAIVERVKNMSLAAYAKGYTFQMKAIHSRDEKEARKFYQMALSKFKMALAMEPDHIDSLLQIFDAVVFLGYDNVAQSLYNTLISIAPHSYLLLYKYATFCEKIKNFELAEDNYLSSLEQNPNYIMCIIAYAKFLSEVANEYEVAEAFFARALSICPRNCFVLFNYATFVYQRRKDVAKANQYFLTALNAPTFEGLDEILLLKDYGRFLKDVLHDDEMAVKYIDSYKLLKDKWETTHESVVEYPKYKSRKCQDVASADYGYVM